MPDSWSNTEIQLIIADYFNMLSAELKGENYSKAAASQGFNASIR